MFSVLGDESKDSVDDLSLSLLQRLRLRKERELLRVFNFPPPMPDPVLSFCEFLGKSCEYKHGVETPCCASHHLKPDSACDCWSVLHKPTRVSTSEVGKNELGRCQMPRKPPKPRCEICKSGVMTCEKHMMSCGKVAFDACSFCLQFNCETGGCEKRICCQGLRDEFVRQHEAAVKATAARAAALAESSSMSLSTVPSSNVPATVPVPAASLLLLNPSTAQSAVTGVPKVLGSSLSDHSHVCA